MAKALKKKCHAIKKPNHAGCFGSAKAKKRHCARKSPKKHCPVKKGHRRIHKRRCAAKIVRVAPRVRVTAPEVNVTTPPPEVNVAPPPPIVQVNAPTPDVHVTTPAPIVNVTPPSPTIRVRSAQDVSIRELREQLREYEGREIEVFNSAGAGSGGEPPNRIGILESVQKGIFTIRPTTDYAPQHIIVYSISQILGFRPRVAVSEP